MAENTKVQSCVVDSSFILSYLLPDESENSVESVFTSLENGSVRFVSTPLLPFEVINGLRSAVKRKRYTVPEAMILLKNFLALPIEIQEVEFSQTFALAAEEDLSAYDAAYLWLAKEYRLKLFSLDKRLIQVAGQTKSRKN